MYHLSTSVIFRCPIRQLVNKNVRWTSIGQVYFKNRPPGGARPLVDSKDRMKHNNWDNIEWTAQQREEADIIVKENSSEILNEDMQIRYENESAKFWNEFYEQHKTDFFKDRQWLFTEFPELLDTNSCIKVKQECSNKIETNPCDKVITEGGARRLNFEAILKDAMDKSNLDDDDRILVQGIQGDDKDIRIDKLGLKLEHFKQNATISKTDRDDAVMQGVQGDLTPAKPVVKKSTSKSKRTIFEVGCGVGNTVIPILETNKDDNVLVYCCDISAVAIDLLKQHELYEQNRCVAFTGDLTDESLSLPFEMESLDIVTMIFVLSSIHPEKMKYVLKRLASYLKPGGIVLFRDYGRFDLTQLRFKKGKCLAPNFYVRGDGTRVYFFTQDELRAIFLEAGLTDEVQNYEDRRLQVNRKKGLEMHRVWIQCKYRKPL